MYGLEHAGPLRVEVGSRSQAQAALDHGSKVGNDISEHVGGYDYIEPLRVLDKPHGDGVNEVEVVFDLWISFCHI